jgi:hypothetical protein
MTRSTLSSAPTSIDVHPASSGLRRRLLNATTATDHAVFTPTKQLEFLDLTLSCSPFNAENPDDSDQTRVAS